PGPSRKTTSSPCPTFLARSSVSPLAVSSPSESFMHCRRFHNAPLTRRDMLLRCANGFGFAALSALLADPAYGATPSRERDPLAPRLPHHEAKAKRVIFLFMDGGPS